MLAVASFIMMLSPIAEPIGVDVSVYCTEIVEQEAARVAGPDNNKVFDGLLKEYYPICGSK